MALIYSHIFGVKREQLNNLLFQIFEDVVVVGTKTISVLVSILLIFLGLYNFLSVLVRYLNKDSFLLFFLGYLVFFVRQDIRK